VEDIDIEVRTWLEQMEFPFDTFMTQLYDVTQPTSELVQAIGTCVMVGNCKDAFDLVCQGFKRVKGFVSVCSLNLCLN